MIIIAIIRIFALRHDVYEFDWYSLIFWQQVEASIAVIMVSFSAFRSFFVAHESRLRDDQRRHRQWYLSKKNRMASALRRKRLRQDTADEWQLGAIPRATLTGMSTFISGGNSNHNEGEVIASESESTGKIRVCKAPA